MRHRGRVVVALLGVLGGLAAACGDQPADGPVSTPTTPVAMTVTISRTGGFAGVNETIEIAPDGSWVYTDGRQNATQNGMLTPAQRLQLIQLVSTPEVAEQLRQRSDTGVCADAFHYVVSVGELSGSFEDCGDDDRPAVRAAIAVVAASTPF